jgi:hypothetical protein
MASATGQGPGIAFPPILQPPNQPSTEVEAPEETPGGSSARTGPGSPPYPNDPTHPKLPGPPYPVVLIRSIAHYRPELGETLTTALWKNYDRMAVQIVSMMEKGW